MGTLDLLTEHLKDEVLRTKSRVLVIAAERHLAGISADDPGATVPGLRTLALDDDAPVDDAMLADVSLLVIEVAPENRGSMQRIGTIRERHPDLPIVAAISDASVSLVRTLVRQGIADVVALPLDLNEVLQVSLDAVAKHDSAATRSGTLAPMVAVVRSIGGCGATSVATHLAADFAAHDTTGRGAVIADLDIQFGSVAEYLGARANGDLSDLLEAGLRLDEELIRSVTGTIDSGVAVIAAPESIMPLESVDTDQLLKVIQLLRQQFGYVVLDLPANWTNWTLSAALAADAVIMVVELSVASLRQAKRRLELFNSVGIDSQAVEIVVNRVEKRLFKTIDLEDVAHTLSHKVLGSIALEAPLVNAAQNQGRLVSELQRKSAFGRDVAKIGELLRGGRLARR